MYKLLPFSKGCGIVNIQDEINHQIQQMEMDKTRYGIFIYLILLTLKPKSKHLMLVYKSRGKEVKI